jgi:hypothetical protein
MNESKTPALAIGMRVAVSPFKRCWEKITDGAISATGTILSQHFEVPTLWQVLVHRQTPDGIITVPYWFYTSELTPIEEETPTTEIKT